MIAGTGIDIIEVARMRDAIERHGERFLRRLFTDREIDYCDRGPRRVQKFAGRFAAKEAALKALGVGWQNGTRFRDLEILNDSLGAPSVSMKERTREIAGSRGVSRLLISISHERSYAVAQAIAIRE